MENTSRTTLRVSEPRELLALVPHRLGFRPARSAVAVSLRGPRGEVGLVMRVDLADLADPRGGPQVARLLVAHLGRDDASRAVLVLYTESDPRGAAGSAAHRAAEHVREAAGALGEVPVWVVTPTGYLALDCADDCCPPGGRPLRDLEATQVGARLVLAGSVVADTRDDVARIVRAPIERRREVARARRRHERRLAAVPGRDATGLEAWRREGLAAWRTAVELAGAADGVAGVPAACWGRLEAALADRRTRDAVLVALIPGTRDLPERSLAGAVPAREEDRAIGHALGLVVDPTCGLVPPPARTALHERVLEQVVAQGRADRQAPALTLLALLAWWRGDGARAGLLLERALEKEPGHRLAVLLARAVTAGVGPGWARHLAVVEQPGRGARA